MNPYAYPKAFVKDEPSEDRAKIEQGKVILGREGDYGKVIYEELLEKVVDLEQGIAKRDFIVVLPNEDEALFVAKGTRLLLYELRGRGVYPAVKEGDEIKPRDSLGYVVTGKYEVRHIRSDTEGVVVHVHWSVGERPERYVIVVVDRNECKRLKVCRGES